MDFVRIRPYSSDFGKIEKNDFSNFLFFLAFSGNSFFLDFYRIGRFVVHRGPSMYVKSSKVGGRNLPRLEEDDQRNSPWVAPACADCPGFLVPGSAPALASTSVSEPQMDPLG